MAVSVGHKVKPGTAGAALLAVVSRETRRLELLGAQGEANVEAVHDMRVACRRLRVSLEDFSALLPARFGGVDVELKWLFGSLGAARDLDVQIERLRNLSAETHAKHVLINLFKAERAKAYESLARQLATERFHLLLNALREVSALDLLELGPAANARTKDFSRHFLKVRMKRAKKRAKKLKGHPRFEDVHAFRKTAKRLRYSIESVESSLGDRAGKMLKRLKKLQDEVGAYVDAHVASDYLRSLIAGQPLDPATLDVARGLIVEQQRVMVEQLPRVRKGWKRVVACGL